MTEDKNENKPCLTNEELAKLLPENFSGTLEIPLGQNVEQPKGETAENRTEGTPVQTGADLDDLANLFWNGAGDVPYVEYGQDYSVTKGEALTSDAPRAKNAEIVEAIKTVQDPELMLNVYDLGLIYRLDQFENGDVEIDMTVTAPACPVAGVMPNQVADAVSALAGVGVVTVKLVWEPAWTMDRLSENARYILDIF